MLPAAPPAQNSGRCGPRHSAHARKEKYLRITAFVYAASCSSRSKFRSLRSSSLCACADQNIGEYNRFCVCGQLLLLLKIQVATVLVTLRMREMKISENNRFWFFFFRGKSFSTIFGEINNILVGLLAIA